MTAATNLVRHMPESMDDGSASIEDLVGIRRLEQGTTGVSGLSCAFRSSHAAVPDPETNSWVMGLTNNYCFYGNATSDMSAC
jgi:hypothetical protein